MKKKICFLMVNIFLLMSACILNCLGAEASDVLKIEAGVSGITVYTGQSRKLSVQVAEKYETKVLKWTSSNHEVGTISSKGVFKAKKAGETTIKVKISGTTLSKSLKVTVKTPVKAKKVQIKNSKKKLGVGSSIQLSAQVFPATSTFQNVSWISSNPAVAKVSSKGKVTALKTGKTKITVQVNNTKVKTSFSLKVVKAVSLKKIKITSTSRKMKVGDSLKLTATLSPSNTTFTNLQWSSSDRAIATVSSQGVVKAKKAGTVKITVTEKDSKKKASLSINVKVPIVQTSGIQFTSGNANKIDVGSKVQLKAQVLPSNATNKQIIWSSSDTSKATVNASGVVTALRPTEYVNIIARTADGKYSATFSMQITANNGLLKKDDLDNLALSSIKKLMIVAHPDDETLWGGSHLLDDEYLVVCLTNGWDSTRKADFINVMNHTNDKRIILSYPDTKRNYWAGNVWTYDTDMWSTCSTGMMKDLELILSYKKWEVVVTHNPDGEYNKYHHKMTSKMVTQVFNKILRGSSNLYYFGRYYNSSSSIPGEQISADNLKIKNSLIQFYLPTAKGAMDAFGHMIPYENWISASQWS